MRKRRFSTSYSPVTMRAVSVLTLSSSACTPVLIFLNKYNCVYLSPPPRVDSPRFEARSGKKFGDFPKCQGRPRESSEGEASLVLMRLSIELLCHELCFLNPFVNGSIIGQL